MRATYVPVDTMQYALFSIAIDFFRTAAFGRPQFYSLHFDFVNYGSFPADPPCRGEQWYYVSSLVYA